MLLVALNSRSVFDWRLARARAVGIVVLSFSGTVRPGTAGVRLGGRWVRDPPGP